MKLIRQAALVLEEGSARKLFEVDLCEVGPNQYVVNYRYGLQGRSLRDASKTIVAVPRQEAERIYDALLREKTDKGYHDPSQSGPVVQAPPRRSQPRPQTREDAAHAQELRRDAYLLARLERREEGDWPLNRVIWRVGELRLTSATPYLIRLVGTGGNLRDYCIAWALGRCGDQSAVAVLGMLHTRQDRSPAVRHMALEALRQVANGFAKASVIEQAFAQLPESIRGIAREGFADFLMPLVQPKLEQGNLETIGLVPWLYLIDNEHVRPVVLYFAQEMPFTVPYFKVHRQLFKAAEAREDAELFGIYAYRFETTPGATEDVNSGRVMVHGRWVDSRSELRKEEPSAAYLFNTRLYFRKRVMRTLRRMGKRGDEAYVRMAVGVLLPFSDDDAQSPRSQYYGYSSNAERVEWDQFAPYLAFNSILYGHSPRYELRPNSRAWRCRSGYHPGDRAPDIREEAFPELWNRVPIGLMHLLAESGCSAVHEFAAKALRANQVFCAKLDNEALLLLLNKSYLPTVQLGFELVQRRYNPAAPDFALIMAVAHCIVPEARRAAHGWLEHHRQKLSERLDLLVDLAFSLQADTRAHLAQLLSSMLLPQSTTQALIGRLIAGLLALKSGQFNMLLARDVANTLLRVFPGELRHLGLEVVRDLVSHPLETVQELGLQVLQNHSVSPADLPEEILVTAMNSSSESVRALGMRLFSQLPDDKLMDRQHLLVAVSVSNQTNVREAARLVIGRLASRHPHFGADLAVLLIAHLLRKERHEGVHNALVTVLKNELGPSLSFVPKETIWKLLHARSMAAKELGGILLGKNIKPGELQIGQVAKLGNHEIASVRRAAWHLFEQSVELIRADLLAAVRILDSKWDDTRAFGFEFFRTRFRPEDYSARVLVGVCDSAREDVQRFGRELITRFFSEPDGPEYMAKLCEHPSTNMQLFVTNYLARYAAGSPQKLKELEPYLYSVLCKVNQGGMAKRRIYYFLREEAQKSLESAQIIADILARQSATMAVGDKAAAIEAMLIIHKQYPQVALPIAVQPVAIRS